MARATDRSKTGNVTIATVRRRDEARQIAARLEAAGIDCAIVEERLSVVARPGRPQPANVKVQVDRSVAKKAIELLRERPGAAPMAEARASAARVRLRLPAHGWLRTGLEVAAILATAISLALLFFLY